MGHEGSLGYTLASSQPIDFLSFSRMCAMAVNEGGTAGRARSMTTTQGPTTLGVGLVDVVCLGWVGIVAVYRDGWSHEFRWGGMGDVS